MAGPVIRFLLRAGIATVFLAAAYSKIVHPTAFALAVDRYDILPWIGSMSVALYLPWLEVLGALGLLFKVAYRGALLLLALLSSIFLLVLFSAWTRDLGIDCGCFGTWGGSSIGWALTRAVAILVGLMALALVEARTGRLTQGRVEYVPIRR